MTEHAGCRVTGRVEGPRAACDAVSAAGLDTCRCVSSGERTAQPANTADVGNVGPSEWSALEWRVVRDRTDARAIGGVDVGDSHRDEVWHQGKHRRWADNERAAEAAVSAFAIRRSV